MFGVRRFSDIILKMMRFAPMSEISHSARSTPMSATKPHFFRPKFPDMPSKSIIFSAQRVSHLCQRPKPLLFSPKSPNMPSKPIIFKRKRDAQLEIQAFAISAKTPEHAFKTEHFYALWIAQYRAVQQLQSDPEIAGPAFKTDHFQRTRCRTQHL